MQKCLYKGLYHKLSTNDVAKERCREWIEKICNSQAKDKKTGLASMTERSRIYVKRWSEIINDIEFRHKYLLDKLKIERGHLSNAENLPELMNELQNNDAAMS